MFTRRETAQPRASLADIKPVERFNDGPRGAMQDTSPFKMVEPAPITPAPSAPKPADPPPLGYTSFTAGSIIGSDLTIMGQGLRIVTRGRLQVDGRIEGDVAGQEVVVGERGHVVGVVSGETVVVQGAVSGTVKGVNVTLQSTARVEGDVHHHKLGVEQGAHLDGRVRRPTDTTELQPDLGPAVG